MKTKTLLIKKANSTTTTTETFKCHKKSTLFDTQNAGNRISELLDLKFFWGACPKIPLRGKGPYSPFSGHSRPFHLQWPLITKVIETAGQCITFFEKNPLCSLIIMTK